MAGALNLSGLYQGAQSGGLSINSMGSGLYGPTNPANTGKGQVLGAATGPTYGPASPGATHSQPASTKQPTGGSQQVAGPQQPANNQPALPNLDQLYAPIFQAYDNTQNMFQQNRDQNTQDIQNSYNQNVGLLPGYQQAAQNTLGGAKQDLFDTVQSAYGQATRNFNAAKNAAIAQFGGGNGASQAFTDLAGQEFARETGNVGQAYTQGQNQLGTEGQNITNWVNQQHSQLDQWLAQAKDQVNQQFSSQLAALSQDRNATEAQKAAGKMQLLEDVMNQNNALAMADQNFRRQLSLVEATANGVGGQNFDMSNFMSQMSGLGNSINGQVNPAQQAYHVASGNSAAGIPGMNPGTASQAQNNDWLNSIAPVSTAAPIPGLSQIPGLQQNQGITGLTGQ